MASLRFKAYLSYSHKDEVWAAWLHRALETYRVPRKLVGNNTNAGSVPARVRPVFRDREDMSSSSDLSETLSQSLADSENLVVICSPAAKASHWVNEEIREFARLGRSKQIFCIIVDGEPADDGSVSGCLPPALAEIGFNEPLAADARKWADGKQAAKLKLVAGMLGLRLDELRQRDMQRRRKNQLLSSVVILAAITLTLMTVFSQISRKHEQEKAEQLATFVVDLGERLQSDSDLETLALISTEASKNLQSLDQDKLSSETGRKVALAVRQMGRVNQFRDKPKEALTAFTKSRDLLFDLKEKYPDDAQILFELGNAEFFIGNLYYRQGASDQALKHMQDYFDLSLQLLATDPDNPDWTTELAYAHNNLAALQMESEKGVNSEILMHVAEATTLMEEVVELRPEDDALIANYSTILAWAADSQLLACNLDKAYSLRSQVKMLAEKSSRQNPTNNELKKNLAFALTGMGRMHSMIGEFDLAKQNLNSSISILQLQADSDPSNVIAKQEVVDRRVMLAKLLLDLGELDTAKPLLETISIAFEPLNELWQRDAGFQKDYIDFMISAANYDYQTQDTSAAKLKLQAAMQHQKELFEAGHRDVSEEYRQANARYLWWQIDGSDNVLYHSDLLGDGQTDASEFQGCNNADAKMRMAIIAQDGVKANREASYLLSKGYAAPDFMKICKQQNLCSGSAQ